MLKKLLILFIVVYLCISCKHQQPKSMIYLQSGKVFIVDKHKITEVTGYRKVLKQY